MVTSPATSTGCVMESDVLVTLQILTSSPDMNSYGMQTGVYRTFRIVYTQKVFDTRYLLIPV